MFTIVNSISEIKVTGLDGCIRNVFIELTCIGSIISLAFQITINTFSQSDGLKFSTQICCEYL